MPVLSIDFETRSRLDLKKVGAHRYAADASTEVLCLAFAVDDGDPQLWVPGGPIPAPIIEAASDPAWLVSAFNAGFERVIMREVMTPKFGWPEIPLERWCCTMAAALAMALPAKLEKLALALGAKEQKDDAGHKLMLKMSKPRKPKKGEDKSKTYWLDDDDRRKRLGEYCMQDVRTEREVQRIVGHLSDAEQAVWRLDQIINERGVMVDRQLCEAAIRLGVAAQNEVNAKLKKLTGGAVSKVGEVKKLLAWLGANGCELEKLGKVTLKEKLTDETLPDICRQVIELRLAGAHAAPKKYQSFRSRSNDDGRIRGALTYHGGGTGRWASWGAQLQNLKKTKREDAAAVVKDIYNADYATMRKAYEHPLSAIGDVARAALIAAPGMRLINADFSGVESRICALVAGETTKIEQWANFDRTGKAEDEPYYLIGKKAGFAEENARKFGKIMDLAFQYGGSKGAYKKFAGKDEEVSDEEIMRRRNAWHEAHPKIVALWARLDAAAFKAIREPNKVCRTNDKIAFCFDGAHLRMRLPSGRTIVYPFARIDTPKDRINPVIYFKDNSNKTFGDCRNGQGAWHGLWMENAVQAIARDVFVEAMQRLEAAGFPVVLHIHDEVVIEVPEASSEQERGESLARVKELMVIPPQWASELPCNVSEPRNGARFLKLDEVVIPPPPPPWDENFYSSLDDDEPEDETTTDDDEAPQDPGPEQDEQADLFGEDEADPFGDGGEYPHGEKRSGKTVAEYIYKTEDNKNHGMVVRKADKQFPQKHWTGSQWKWGAPKIQLPYHLPEVLKAPDDQLVFITEGEKDADNVAEIGLASTTNPGGAEKWSPALTPWFIGKRLICICEDNDDVGRRHARQVATAFLSLFRDSPPVIKILSFPELPEKGDVSDFLAKHSKADLLARCEATPIYNPVAEDDAITADELDKLVFEDLKYIVPGFVIPGLTLFAGKPKIGKSWWLVELAYAVAGAGFTLGGIPCEDPGDVLYAALEDNKRRLQSRLRKLFGATPKPKALTLKTSLPRLAAGGLDYLKNWISRSNKPRLIIIDTLKMVRTPPGKSQSAYEADYDSLVELRDLANAHGVAIIVVHHTRKAEAEDAFDTISGTLGLTGCPDTIMVIYHEGSGVVLAAKGRDLETIEKAVRFDRDACRWSVQGDADQVRQSGERNKILAALAEAGDEPLSATQIAAATGMKASNVRNLLNKMKRAGTVMTAQYGKYVLAGASTKEGQTNE